VVVSNSGPVAPSYEVESLFEPFRRLHDDRTGGDRWVGLGLLIARSIVRAHDGEVTAEPRPEGGPVVRVMLPAAIPAGDAVSPAPV
jgi:K+-sensing histidine kinase KdpD